MPLKTYGILNKSWPLYRGKRAGKQVKLREITRRWPVQVIQSREINRAKGLPTTRSCRNPNNRISI